MYNMRGNQNSYTNSAEVKQQPYLYVCNHIISNSFSWFHFFACFLSRLRSQLHCGFFHSIPSFERWQEPGVGKKHAESLIWPAMQHKFKTIYVFHNRFLAENRIILVLALSLSQFNVYVCECVWICLWWWLCARQQTQ